MSDLTVILSTYNGEDVINETLEGYCRLSNIGMNWKMIIVNNGSTDRTVDILHGFLDRLPITVFHHNALGKNKALNAAQRFIDSEFIIMTDDDAVPQDGFLQSWLEVFRRNPNFDIFGGAIVPYFMAPPPDWMVESKFHFEELYAERSLADGPIKATEIFGPNMAVRKKIFDSGIKFNEDIGPSGNNKNYPMGSETEFCHRVELKGYKAYFSSKPSVKHIVRPHQIRDEYWINRAFKHGLGFGLQNKFQYSSRSLLKRNLSQLKYYANDCIRRIQIWFIKDRLKHNQMVWELYWNRGFSAGRSEH